MTHLIGHAHRTLAIKPLPDGRVMISGGWRGRWDERSGKGLPIADQVEGNRREAVAVYPALADLALDEVHTDRAEMLSADGIPIIDYLPGAANMLVGVGWSGHGWAIAPAVARLMAEWVLSGERSPLLAPFGYGRFPRQLPIAPDKRRLFAFPGLGTSRLAMRNARLLRSLQIVGGPIRSSLLCFKIWNHASFAWKHFSLFAAKSNFGCFTAPTGRYHAGNRSRSPAAPD